MHPSSSCGKTSKSRSISFYHMESNKLENMLKLITLRDLTRSQRLGRVFPCRPSLSSRVRLLKLFLSPSCFDVFDVFSRFRSFSSRGKHNTCGDNRTRSDSEPRNNEPHIHPVCNSPFGYDEIATACQLSLTAITAVGSFVRLGFPSIHIG